MLLYQTRSPVSHAGGEGALQALQAALATSEAQRITAEATLAHAIAAKDADIARLTLQLDDAAERQRVLEGEVEALQASKVALQAQHVDDETVMLHGLRGEMAVLEQRLRDEQAAHAASIHQVWGCCKAATLAMCIDDTGLVYMQHQDSIASVNLTHRQNSDSVIWKPPSHKALLILRQCSDS